MMALAAGDGPAHAGALEPVADLLASGLDDARRDAQALGAELRIAHPVAVPEQVVNALSRFGRGLDMDAQRGDDGAQPAGVQFGAPVARPPVGQVGPWAGVTVGFNRRRHRLRQCPGRARELPMTEYAIACIARISLCVATRTLWAGLYGWSRWTRPDMCSSRTRHSPDAS